MPNLLSTIQTIAVNAVNSTNPISFVFGTVTSADPLKIRMDQSTIELEGGSLILTANVIEKKLVINKHSHTDDESLVDYTATGNSGAPIIFAPVGVQAYVANPNFDPNKPRTDTDEVKGTPVLPLKHNHAIHDTVVDAYVYEEGKDDDDHKLAVEKDDERIVVTVNRPLKKGDKVIMLRVSGGQRFIVMSRLFQEE